MSERELITEPAPEAVGDAEVYLATGGMPGDEEVPTVRRFGVGFWLSVAVLVFVIVLAIVGPWLGPPDGGKITLGSRLDPPFSTSPDGTFHLLGTDSLGRDVLNLLADGARVSVTVAAATVAVSLLVGTTLGLVAGYFGGFIGGTIMRLVDLMLAFPTLLLALVLLFALGPSMISVVAVLAFTRWPLFARVGEGLVLAIKHENFVLAARALGSTNQRIIRVHILPNILSTILILATLEVAIVIPAEAGLSFLGLGIQPPSTSWGVMIADGRPYLETAWWLVVFPAVTILLVTLSFNYLAIWLRERS